MKVIITSGLLACAFTLGGCAAPEAAPDAANTQSIALADDSDGDKVMLTGSRIPQRSTSHTVKQTGGKDYRKAAGEAGQHNPDVHH